MTTLPHLARTLQSVFTTTADAAAHTTGFIKRVRAFTGGWMDGCASLTASIRQAA